MRHSEWGKDFSAFVPSHCRQITCSTLNDSLMTTFNITSNLSLSNNLVIYVTCQCAVAIQSLKWVNFRGEDCYFTIPFFRDTLQIGTKWVKVKVKFTLVEALRLCTGRTARRGSRGIALLFLTTALEGVEGSASRPGRSLPRAKTRYPLYTRLVGPQGRSGQVRKISPPPEFDPRTVQPVASHYTDWAIMV